MNCRKFVDQWLEGGGATKKAPYFNFCWRVKGIASQNRWGGVSSWKISTLLVDFTDMGVRKGGGVPAPPGFWVKVYLRDHFFQQRPAAVATAASCN